MQLIDGKAIAERIKDDVVREVADSGGRPNLAIILVGEREDSKIYVTLKERQAKEVGIDTHVYKCDADMKEEALLAAIDYLNEDKQIDGILIQLPLPAGLDTDKVVARMSSAKDIDGFQPENLKNFLNSCDSELQPPLVMVIAEILEEIAFAPEGKKVVALVNSEILGKVIKHSLECSGAQVELVFDNDPALTKKASQADILITALGKPKFVKTQMVKDNAVVIDIGINRLPDGSVCGDVDEEDLSDKEGYLTPVPGGVGPITIAAAFKNTLELYKKKKSLIEPIEEIDEEVFSEEED